MRFRLAFALVALSLSGPRSALASPLIEAAGPIGGNAGEQGVVSGPGAASTYFNPALLIEAPDEALLGYSFISEQMGVTLEGRPIGSDVPLVVAGRNILAPGSMGLQPLPNSVVPTQWLQQGCSMGGGVGQCSGSGFAARPRQSQGTSGVTRHYLVLGLVRSFFARRLAVGAYAMLPISNFTTEQSFYVDEREALFSNSLHPELYGDRLTSVSVVVGAAVRIVPELSVGASVSLGLANTAGSQDYVQDATNYNTLLLDNRVETNVSLAPTFGVRYKPSSWLRFGAVVHAPESFTLHTSIDNALPSGTESSTSQTSVFDWMPWSVGVGAEVVILRRGAYSLSAVGSIHYAFWSAYQDRQGDSPSLYGQELAWHDTPSGTLGVRHAYRNLRGYFDLRYIPSPVPEQVGRSNYVDNDRAGVGFGGDITLHLPTVLRPGFQLFVDRLIPRTNQKDPSLLVDELPDGSVYNSTLAPVPGAHGLQTNNPGWPGYSSKGFLWGGSITLSIPL